MAARTSASVKLQQQLEQAQELLYSIKTELYKYDSINQPDWGHVGDITHTNDELEKVLSFLMNSRQVRDSQ